ncbi:hypothetical protein VCHA53O466_40195 [Vibrio chagasii]|nr:hypothetical protein VCHA53O466_40195 [Vibrio chagasii]
MNLLSFVRPIDLFLFMVILLVKGSIIGTVTSDYQAQGKPEWFVTNNLAYGLRIPLTSIWLIEGGAISIGDVVTYHKENDFFKRHIAEVVAVNVERGSPLLPDNYSIEGGNFGQMELPMAHRNNVLVRVHDESFLVNEKQILGKRF